MILSYLYAVEKSIYYEIVGLSCVLQCVFAARSKDISGIQYKRFKQVNI